MKNLIKIGDSFIINGNEIKSIFIHTIGGRITVRVVDNNDAIYNINCSSMDEANAIFKEAMEKLKPRIKE